MITMVKKLLFKKDIEVLHDLENKHIKTKNLENIFSKINLNHRFKDNEKQYLKKILIDNINNAYKKKHSEA